jgi:hypothetical protein
MDGRRMQGMRKRWLCLKDSSGGLQLVDITEGAELSPSAPSLFIHQDSIDPTWHPADGKIYDSKSAFRRTTRAHGCREIGDSWVNKDGTINRNAVATQSKPESVKETLVRVLKGDIH